MELGSAAAEPLWAGRLARTPFAAALAKRRTLLHVHEKSADMFNLLKHAVTKIEVMRAADAALLAAGLAAEAIARENDRIENFEADVRERAMFNRRRKAELFMARREAEIAEFQDEQERRRLMDHYLGPYSEWAASHYPPPPSPPSRSAGGSY